MLFEQTAAGKVPRLPLARVRRMRSNPHMLSHPLWGNRSATATIGLLLLFTVFSSACGDSPSSQPTGIAAASYPTTGIRTLTLIDTSRPTAPNRGAPGLPSRTLPTDVYYPAIASPSPARSGVFSPVDCLGGAPSGDPAGCSLTPDLPLDSSAAPYPLIVLSHGFGNGKEALRYFAIALAQHGYIVAAPTFPLSNENTPGGPVATDLVAQGGDVSFLFDVFLGEVPSMPSPFPGGIDASRLGTGGRSLGGSTTLVDAYHPTYRDPRIRAAAPISPSFDVAKAVVGANGFFSGINTPLLIVGGSEDDLAPFPANQQLPYDLANPPKILVEVLGAGHVPEVEATNRSLVAFFDAYLRGRTSELAELDHLEGVRVEHSL